MHRKFNPRKCPILETVDIISSKWVILVIVIIGNSERLRYNEIMERLNGISPKSLADTLKELEGSGLINRQAFNEIPRRVEYSLTKTGLGLYRSTIPLLRWAADKTGDKDCEILQVAISKKI